MFVGCKFISNYLFPYADLFLRLSIIKSKTNGHGLLISNIPLGYAITSTNHPLYKKDYCNLVLDIYTSSRDHFIKVEPYIP